MSQLTELDPMLVTPLRRPEPRPRKRRSVPSAGAAAARPAMTKAAAGLVGAALCLAFAGRIASVALEPVLLTERTGGDIQQLEVQVRRESEMNRRLQADISYLKTSAGVEQEARRRGWVKPGEVALSLVAPKSGADDLLADEPEIAKPKPSVSARIRAAVDTCLAVFGGAPKTR